MDRRIRKHITSNNGLKQKYNTSGRMGESEFKCYKEIDAFNVYVYKYINEILYNMTVTFVHKKYV